MIEFQYTRPSTLAEAVTSMASEGARALAGGTDLIPQVRERRKVIRCIVDVKRIPEMTAIIAEPDGGWRIGAATSIRALRKHSGFFGAHRELVEAAEMIGSIQVQSRASLGGNLCNAAPSADGVPLLFALDAMAEVHGPLGMRRVAVEGIPSGPGRTTLAPAELLVALQLPARAAKSAYRYLRFTPRREMDIAIAGAGVRLDLADNGKIAVARIVLASVGPVPIRARRAEAILVGERPSQAVFEAAGVAAAEEAQPISDTRGSAAYRRDLVAVLTRRAFTDCVGRLGVSLG